MISQLVLFSLNKHIRGKFTDWTVHTLIWFLWMLLLFSFIYHHFPFCTDVWSWTQDDQQTCLIGQIQKMLQISVAGEVVDALYGFVEVPGHISVWRQSIFQRNVIKEQDRQGNMYHSMHVVSLHLDGVESGHVHLKKPVLPVVTWDPGVVDASWDVLKRFSIFQKTVVFVVYRERPFSRDLQETAVQSNWASVYWTGFIIWTDVVIACQQNL